MSNRACAIGFLSLTVALTSAATAQRVEVRFRTTSDTADVRWQGEFNRLTPDSLEVRLRGTDTIAVFSRTVIRSVERRGEVNSIKAAGVGCLMLGVPLGALIKYGSNDGEQGLANALAIVGFGVGCGVGAVGGLVVAAVGQNWEPWPLAESVPSRGPPDER